MERRKHYRVEVEYHASFSGPSLRGQGVISNLSIGGCRARSSFPINKEDSYGVLIDVPRYQHPLYVASAVVKWVHHPEFGLKFIQMELVDQHHLCELVRALKASLRSPNMKGDMR